MSQLETFTKSLDAKIPQGIAILDFSFLISYFLDMKVLVDDPPEIQMQKQLAQQKWKSEQIAAYTSNQEKKTGMFLFWMITISFSYGHFTIATSK